MTILIPIVAITNYHNFFDFKQHLFIISQFCRSQVQWTQLGAWPRFPAGWPGFLSGGCGGESMSRLIRDVSRVEFRAVVGLSSPFACWLSAQGSFSASRGRTHSLVRGFLPLSLKPAGYSQVLLRFQSFWPPFSWISPLASHWCQPDKCLLSRTQVLGMGTPR